MCPALILAANRKDSVIGCTKSLTLSTITKNGFNHSGAPPGNNLAKNLVGAHKTPERTILNHKGTPSLNVNTK